MKKIFLVFFSCLIITNLLSQRTNTGTRKVDTTKEKPETEESDDKSENRFFWGGGLVASFGGVNLSGNTTFSNGNQLILGVIPEIGYSIAKPLDVGLCFNLIYYSTTYNEGGTRVRQTAFNYGVGAFTRLHITDGLFITGIVEQNFFNFRQSLPDISGFPVLKDKVNSLNALVGVGWGSRSIGEGGFYSSILLDVNKDKNSPYTIQGTPFPVFRAGFITYFKKKNR